MIWREALGGASHSAVINAPFERYVLCLTVATRETIQVARRAKPPQRRSESVG